MADKSCVVSDGMAWRVAWIDVQLHDQLHERADQRDDDLRHCHRPAIRCAKTVVPGWRSTAALSERRQTREDRSRMDELQEISGRIVLHRRSIIAESPDRCERM